MKNWAMVIFKRSTLLDVSEDNSTIFVKPTMMQSEEGSSLGVLATIHSEDGKSIWILEIKNNSPVLIQSSR